MSKTPLKDKRRKQILNAANEVFGKDGFHKGTVESIAGQAGLGKGTIYEYFTSKQEIFEKMILALLEDYLDGAKFISKEKPTFYEKLLAISDFDKNFVRKNSNVIENSLAGLQDLSEDFQPLILGLHKNAFDFFLGLVIEAKENNEINKDLDEESVTIVLINIIKGTNTSREIFGLNENIDSKEIIDVIFKGLSPTTKKN